MDGEKLKGSEPLGMNMVFLDTDKANPYADCVALDNDKAIHVIYQKLGELGDDDIGYAGWKPPGYLQWLPTGKSLPETY